MRIDAIAVVSHDLARSMEFYALIGFAFPPLEADAKHVEAITPEGGVRLMLDHADLIQSMTGAPPRPANYSVLALHCDDKAGVDAAVARIEAAGFTVVKPPWDAFWGQRYAIIADPDGARIDLFAPL